MKCVQELSNSALSKQEQEQIDKFIRRGALHFNSTKNEEQMLEFVRKFPTPTTGRKFLER